MLLPSALGFSPHPPVSVYGTGTCCAIAAFPGTRSLPFPTLVRSTSRSWVSHGGFSSHVPPSLVPVFSFPAGISRMRPRSSDSMQYRNLHLLSIGCAFRPRLRSRLTQGRSALPWNPWIFGRKDSHLPLATHSGILSSRSSTAPFGTASLNRQCSPTNAYITHAFPSFGGVFQPRTFSARGLSASELLRTLLMDGCF